MISKDVRLREGDQLNAIRDRLRMALLERGHAILTWSAESCTGERKEPITLFAAGMGGLWISTSRIAIWISHFPNFYSI